MKVDVLMPKMGESITEGRILTWHKKPGDQVDRDETILEIATDKVDTEVPSPATGVLVQALAAEGDTVEVGTVIAVIETDASQAVVSDAAAPAVEGMSQPPHAEPSPGPAPAAATPLDDEPAPTPAAVAGDDDLAGRFYSPVVLRIASERGLTTRDLASVPGTGAHGRVTKQDLLGWLERGGADAATQGAVSTTTPSVASRASGNAAAGSPLPATRTGAAGDVEVIPMDNMRRLMAEHMVRSKQISPHVALVSEADMFRITAFRDANAAMFKQREGISLTFMPFIALATIRALKDFPLVNASIDGTNILLKRAINLGIAVAMSEGGLIVPVVKHADTLNEVGLARAIHDVASRARMRKLQPDEIQDGTFTITNFGVFGNMMGLPIINQPQVAILGVGALKKRPVVIERDGEDFIAIRPVVQLSLSFDHRLIDGALGGAFLQRIVTYLEEFDLQSI